MTNVAGLISEVIHQAAFPNRQVISLLGDGGFAMLMGDFLTLAQHQLPVKVIVYNNGSLGFVALEMKAEGLLEFGTDFDNPDFAAMVRSMNIQGVRVEDPGDPEAEVAAVLAHPGPALLDVVTNKHERTGPPVITAAQVKGFGLWGLRAVLNGRCDEIIEGGNAFKTLFS